MYSNKGDKMTPEVMTGLMTAVSVLVAAWGLMFDQGLKQTQSRKSKGY